MLITSKKKNENTQLANNLVYKKVLGNKLDKNNNFYKQHFSLINHIVEKL